MYLIKQRIRAHLFVNFALYKYLIIIKGITSRMKQLHSMESHYHHPSSWPPRSTLQTWPDTLLKRNPISNKGTYLGVVEQLITENDNYQPVACENCGGVIMTVIVMKPEITQVRCKHINTHHHQ